MIILGIDPGTAKTGFGVIAAGAGTCRVLDFGCITTPAGTPKERRLRSIYLAIQDLIRQHRPEIVSVEALFFSKNVKTAMAVGESRGVVLLCAAQANLPIAEYTPMQVKEAISGYGKATKRQMQTMVQLALSMEDPPRHDDAADALAVAFCHWSSQELGLPQAAV